MTEYQKSLRRIAAAEACYQLACHLAETDDAIGAALEVLHQLKQAHREAFGSLTRVNGEWI